MDKEEHLSPGFTGDWDEWFCLTHLTPQETGLPLMIWCSCQPIGVDTPPRMWVTIENCMYPLLLDRVSPIWQHEIPASCSNEDFLPIAMFICVHFDTLMNLWNGELSTLKLLINLGLLPARS